GRAGVGAEAPRREPPRLYCQRGPVEAGNRTGWRGTRIPDMDGFPGWGLYSVRRRVCTACGKRWDRQRRMAGQRESDLHPPWAANRLTVDWGWLEWCDWHVGRREIQGAMDLRSTRQVCGGHDLDLDLRRLGHDSL